MSKCDPDRGKKSLKVIDDGDGVMRLNLGEEGAPFADSLPGMPTDALAEKLTQEVAPAAPVKSPQKSNLPRVEEILSTEVEEEDFEENWGQRKTIPMGWFVLLLAVILGFAAWATVKTFNSKGVAAEAEQEVHQAAEKAMREKEDARKVLAGMKECADGYCSAGSIEEMLPFVRHVDRVKPLMASYYQKEKIKPLHVEELVDIKTLGVASYSFAIVTVVLEDGSRQRLLMEQDGEFSFKVDWESSVCYMPMAWDEYRAAKSPDPMDLRVYVEVDNFYAYEFSEDKMVCFLLKAKGSEDHLYGYVSRESKTGKQMVDFFKRATSLGGEKQQLMLLKLRFPKKTRSKNCVWIDEVVSTRWLYVLPPEKE